MGKLDKITCEAYTRKSIKEGNPRKCRGMGRFIPNSKRFLCGYHNGHRSWTFLTGQYKGLYKNPNLPMINKIKVLKNLKNFKGKTDDEIKQYIESKQRLAIDNGFRSKFYTRQFNSWKNKHRDSEGLTNSFDKTLQSFRSRRKF
jgi:hypothetical protein